MVSVIIPVYNGEVYLEACLHSVANQFYRDLDILLIDDGSTDSSLEIGRRFARMDNRVRLLHQKNAGVSAARNRGLEAARGEYIAFVDADDLLPETAIANLLNAAVPGIDLVTGSFTTFRRRWEKRIRRPQTVITVAPDKKELYLHDDLLGSPCGTLYRRSIIAENGLRFDETLPFGEDGVFNMAYCKYVRRIRVIRDVVYRYRSGGYASTVRYYPDRHEISLKILRGYCVPFGGTEKIPAVYFRKKTKQYLMSCLLHYAAHCEAKVAREKIEETLSRFAPYLNGETVDEELYPPELAACILRGDAQGVLVFLRRRHRFFLLRKKAKMLYYRFFHRRI